MIRESRIKICSISIMFVGFLGSANYLYAQAEKQKPQTKTSAKKIQTSDYVLVQPRSCQIDDGYRLNGIIESDEEASISTDWTVPIKKIHVVKGQSVKKGQLIVSADTTDIERQIQLYEDYFVLYQNESTNSERDKMSRAKRLANIQLLVQQGIISKSDLESLERDIENVKSYQKQMSRVAKSIADTLKDLNDRKTKANMYAPIDGVVTFLFLDPRSFVGQVYAWGGTVVAKIEKPGRAAVKTKLLDTEVGRVKLGDRAVIKLADDRIYNAVVSEISPLGTVVEKEDDANNQAVSENSKVLDQLKLFNIKLQFSYQGDVIPSGVSADISMASTPIKSQRCLPWNAISQRDNRYIIKSYNPSAGWRELGVTLGRRGQYWVEVVSAVPQGEMVASLLW